MSVHIIYDTRPATPADIPAMARIFLSSLDTSIPGYTFSDKPGYSIPEMEEFFTDRFVKDGGKRTVFVALRPGTGEVLGYVSINEIGGALPKGCERTSEVHVPEDAPVLGHLFAVVPKEGGGGQGVGSALMRRMLAEERWVKKGIRLMCFERNLRALRFYEKWGFQQVGRKENYAAVEGEAAVMLWRTRKPEEEATEE